MYKYFSFIISIVDTTKKAITFILYNVIFKNFKFDQPKSTNSNVHAFICSKINFLNKCHKIRQWVIYMQTLFIIKGTNNKRIEGFISPTILPSYPKLIIITI